MNVKLVVSVLMVGGALLFSGIQPSYLLEQGGNVLQAFSRDFMALFNGEAVERVAKENKGKAEVQVHEYYAADPATTDEDVLSVVNDVNRDLSEAEAARRSAIFSISTKELKQPVEGQNVNIEELKQHLEDQRRLVE